MSVPSSNEALKKSALIWTIAGFLCGGPVNVIALILGIIGYTKADTDPAGAAPLVKWAKILTIVGAILTILIVIAYLAFIFFIASNGGFTVESN